MRMRPLALVAVLLLVPAACGDNDAEEGTEPTAAPPSSTTRSEPPPTTAAPATPPSDYAAFRRQPTACGAQQPGPVEDMEFSAPGDMAIGDMATATITTSCGEIVVTLDPAGAPQSVNSFIFLASEGYFDGSASHRIIPGFVMQAGDPTATGLGGPGYLLPDEFPPEDFVYEKGTVAMANAGPDTTGSQFFIMLEDGALPPQFTVIGHVTEGAEVLERIAAIPLGVSIRGELSVPLETLYIEKVAAEF